MSKPMTVLVAGATGQQGGAVARALLERGHRVKALTRRPASPAAEALRELGARVVEGDLEDLRSLRRALEGAGAFYLVATPFEAGVEAELRQGFRGADAARAAGVKHLVYSSVAGADRGTGVPHFESKREIERHIASLGVPFTIVAPVFFMENFLGPSFVEGLRRGALAMPLPPSRPLQLLAVADLAAFACVALERGAELESRRVELASDELDGLAIARSLARATRSGIAYAEVPVATVRARSEDMARMWEWFARVGYGADVQGLRREYPEVGWHDLGAWARAQDWSAMDVASPEQPTI